MACRSRRPIAEGLLLRLVAGADGSVQVGPRLSGRGAWVCGTHACLTRALRPKVLVRALRAEITPQAATRLREELQSNFPARSPDARD